MTRLLEGLLHFNRELDKSDKMLRTVDSLLKSGEITGKNGILNMEEGVKFETIYDSNCTITIASHPKRDTKTPKHCHLGIKEYLICTKGSFCFNMGNSMRILEVKDCASVPEGAEHSTTSLEDNSVLVAICIPEETAYKRSKCE